MKHFLTIIILVTLVSLTADAQTNVSGGIFSNTTWMLANSPYIVTDTIVVFPGVTLTIEPGVVVKFDDHMQMEIRQGQLLAIGNATDSITFTSNSLTPTQGIYCGIILNGGTFNAIFTYCNFRYAIYGISANISDTLIVNNSIFNQNSTGLQFIGSSIAELALVDSCNFTNNSIGLKLQYLHSRSINHCHFSHNTYGMTGDAHNNSLNLLRNCVFDFNNFGIYQPAYITVDSCTILHNHTGIVSGSAGVFKNCIVDSNSVYGIWTSSDSVINCSIKYNLKGIVCYGGGKIIGNDIEYNTLANIAQFNNGNTVITGNTIKYSNVGIDTISGNYTITNNVIENNAIGINLFGSTGVLSCNRICNNTSYDLNYRDVGNFDASHNFWCTPDSASTEAVIFDAHDNINYGIVNFMPIDSACSPVILTSKEEIAYLAFAIFPNPAHNTFVIKTVSSSETSLLQIINSIGETVHTEKLFGSREYFIDANLARGIYFVRVSDRETNAVRMLVVE